MQHCRVYRVACTEVTGSCGPRSYGVGNREQYNGAAATDPLARERAVTQVHKRWLQQSRRAIV